MKILQYVFYKLLIRYSRKGLTPIFQTIIVFNICYALFLVDILITIQLILRHNFLGYLPPITKETKLFLIILIGVLQYLFTYFLFMQNKSLEDYENVFINEKPFWKKYGESILIVLIYVLVIIFLALGYANSNLFK